MIAKRAGLVLPTLPHHTIPYHTTPYHDTAKVNVDFTADASMQPRSCLTSDYFYVDDDDNYDGDVFNDVYDDDDNYHDYGHNDGHAKLSWCQIYL